MSVRLVLDASVAAKLFYIESGRDAAMALIDEGVSFIAPDLIFAEFAHLSARKASVGGVSPELAKRAVANLAAFLEEVWPTKPLAERACDLAIMHGFSAYDAIYLCLAIELNIPLVTADMRLVTRAAGAGVGSWVRALGDEARPNT